MNLNPNYSQADWIAYQDMWWILDEQPKSSVRWHSRSGYLHQRSTDTVMVWFSSQRDAASTLAPNFVKLNAARAAANYLAEQ